MFWQRWQMKRIKMKTIMASATRTANIGDIVLVDDNFADELIKSNSAELIDEILEEAEEKKEPQKKSKKRKR